jgi:hypothetical protein
MGVTSRIGSPRAPAGLVAAASATTLLAALGASGCATAPATLPPDQACLDLLRAHGVVFSEGPQLRGVRTPVTLHGGLFAPRLAPRHGRPAEMDCQLAVALIDAAPIFRRAKIDEIEYSAAYHYRNRRRSNQLSMHAAGLAIDVHVFRGPEREYVVERNFERRPALWRKMRQGSGALQTCLGRPRTSRARTLRYLACQLRLNESFRLIITPDDDSDHRDHFHLEARPDTAATVKLPPPPARLEPNA